MRWWMQLLHLIGLSEWKRGINEKCNMLIGVFCDCLDDDPNLLIAKMIWWHHCRLELLEFIVSSLWCEIVYFHWFMYTMMRHVVIMTIKNSFYKWLIQSWWEMVPASDIVLMGKCSSERFVIVNWWHCFLCVTCLLIVIDVLVACNWTTWHWDWLIWTIWLLNCEDLNCEYWACELCIVELLGWTDFCASCSLRRFGLSVRGIHFLASCFV